MVDRTLFTLLIVIGSVLVAAFKFLIVIKGTKKDKESQVAIKHEYEDYL